MDRRSDGRLRWIEHKGRAILLTDFSNLQGDALTELITESNDYIISAGSKRNDGLLILSDITGAVIGTEAVLHFKESLEATAPYTKAGAQVGVEGMKKHILKFLNENSPFEAQAFESEVEAKDWLAERTIRDS